MSSDEEDYDDKDDIDYGEEQVELQDERAVGERASLPKKPVEFDGEKNTLTSIYGRLVNKSKIEVAHQALYAVFNYFLTRLDLVPSDINYIEGIRTLYDYRYNQSHLLNPICLVCAFYLYKNSGTTLAFNRLKDVIPEKNKVNPEDIIRYYNLIISLYQSQN